MKIVVNKCFGGYSLSFAAVQRLQELRGKGPIYAFDTVHPKDYKDRKYTYTPSKDKSMFSTFFDVNNPNDFSTKDLWDNHYITNSPEDRADLLLVQVVEELGDKADGGCAKLVVVEIPDGVEYTIDDYDGQESIHEVHRRW